MPSRVGDDKRRAYDSTSLYPGTVLPVRYSQWVFALNHSQKPPETDIGGSILWFQEIIVGEKDQTTLIMNSGCHDDLWMNVVWILESEYDGAVI